MGNFIFHETNISGLVVVETRMYGDNRGYFMETWHYEEFSKAGLNMRFVQDNQSKSKRGVLRGLHYQKEKPQGKLVRVISGEVYDVAVDIRPDSATYGEWFGQVLSAENCLQLYVPERFAHGFLVLSETAEFVYKCTNFYDPSDEGAIIWNDPDIGIRWPLTEKMELILSNKDRSNPRFRQIEI